MSARTARASILPRLADADVLRIGVPRAQGGLGGHINDAVGAIAAVSSHSLAAGFVFWGHRTLIEYLLQSPNERLRDRLLPDLLSGRRAGATGLSNAMKFLSGVEALEIQGSSAGRRAHRHRKAALGDQSCARRASTSRQQSGRRRIDAVRRQPVVGQRGECARPIWR